MAGSYDRIVLEYLEQPDSSVVIFSEDEAFKKNLRATLNKTLGIKREVLSVFASPQPLARFLKDRMGRSMPTVLFIEGVMNGRTSASYISKFKGAYPGLHIVALVGESRREDVAYLYEIGAGNVIAKPASVNNIIEKLAFTIRPQGRLTELISSAQAFMSRDEHDKALVVCKKVMTLKPGSPSGLMFMGDALLGLGRREEALNAYRKAHSNAGQFLEPLKRLVDFYRDEDPDKCLRYLEKLDKLSPLHASRKKDIGEVHLNQGDEERAERYFDLAIECATREAEGIIENVAGGIASLVQERSPYLAEKYLAKMIDAKGDRLTRADLGTFNRLGIALKAQGKWELAIENYKKALTIAPDDEGLYYNVGMAFFDGGRMDDAYTSFRKARRLNPGLGKGNATVSYNMANVCLLAGKIDEARKLARQALEAKGSHQGAAKLLREIEVRAS